MATPNVQISSLALSDVNAELQYTPGHTLALGDQVVRILTGNSASSAAGAPIAFSALSNKIAFSGLVANATTSNTGYGTVGATLVLSANSDLYSPRVVWSWNVISITAGATTLFAGDGQTSNASNGSLQFDGDSKIASFALFSSGVGQADANVYVSLQVYAGDVEQHYVGTANGYFHLTSTVVAPDLVTVGTNSVIANGFSAQTATTIISASSNVASGVIRFTTNPSGKGTVSGNTISFSTSAIVPDSNSNFACQLTTEVLLNGAVLQANVRNISLSANYQTTDLVVSGPTSNNQFANNGVTSSLTLSGVHYVAGANVEWIASKVSGDTATFAVEATNASANLYVTFGAGTFGTMKSVYDVVATLKYANGMVLSQKTNRLTIRAGSYGLSYTPAANVTATGYAAQTASSAAGATYKAGAFTWQHSRLSGVVPSTTETITANTASLIITTSVNGIGTSSNTIYSVVPVLKFDGVVMNPNTTSSIALNSEFLNYAFTVFTGSSNTAVGAGTQEASMIAIGSHTVSGGTIVWSRNDAGVAITSNTTVANVNVTASTGQQNNHSFNLSATLRDATDRTVTVFTSPIRLSAFSPVVTFNGPVSNTLTSYAAPVVATAIIEATCSAGANAFSISQTKTSGDDLTLSGYSGNTIYDKVTIEATTSAISTVSGTYHVTATVTYFDKFYQTSFDTTVEVGLIASDFSTNGFSGGENGFTPQSNVVGITAQHSVPGGILVFSHLLNSSSGGSGVIEANTSSAYLDQLIIDTNAEGGYAVRVSDSAIGQHNYYFTFTGKLYDPEGRFVGESNSTGSYISQIYNPAFLLQHTSNTASVGACTINLTSSLTVTANATLQANASNSALVGETYQFLTTHISGSQAVITYPTADTAKLALTGEGMGSYTSVTDVTARLLKDGFQLGEITRRMTLNANVTTPNIFFTVANGASNSFNYPVIANGVINAYTDPTTTVEWSYTKISGADLAISNTANTFTVSSTTSSVGSNDAIYQVTATFKNAANEIVATRSANVSAAAVRHDPGFVWAVTPSTNVLQKGWEQSIVALANVAASVNSSLTGSTFVVSSVKISGVNAVTATSNTLGTASVSLTSNSAVSGFGVRTSVYDVTCDLRKDAQVISGPFTQRITVTTEPYWLTFTYNRTLPASNTNQDCAVIVYANSNHESWLSSNTVGIWNRVSSDPAFLAERQVDKVWVGTSKNAGGAYGEIILNRRWTTVDRTVVYNIDVSFSANGATRSANTDIQLTVVG